VTPLSDPFYGTAYSIEPFSDALKEKMANPKVKEGAALGLPPKNTLLPQNLEVLPKSEEDSEVPKKIKEYAGESEVWYMKDDKFERPKAIVNMKLYPHKGLLQGLGLTAEGKMIAEVWASCIKEYLREFIYMAQMASLELEISVLHDSVAI
jgi:secreted Zn-dependent insulinase-like peptidase